MPHRFEPNRLRTPRTLVFGLLFITLLALSGFIFSANSTAAPAAPADTLPPGGTIPPGTLPPFVGPPLSGLINVLHLAPFDPIPANTAVVLCNDDDDSFVAGPLQYGQESGYINLAIGAYDWYVALDSIGCGTPLLDLPAFDIFGGSKLTLIVYGGANGYPPDSVLIVEVLGMDVDLLPLVRNEPQP